MIQILRRNAIALAAYILTFMMGVFFGAGITVLDIIIRGM